MSQTSANVTNRQASIIPLSRALRAGLLGGVLAALGNLVIYVIALSLLGDLLVVPIGSGGQLVPLSPINVALNSFLPGVVAGLLLAGLSRVTSQPVQWMLGVSLSYLLFSFTAPLGLANIPDLTRVVLAGMHVVAAVAILGILLKYGR